ncbi:MAG: hypothetical protein R8J94_15860 [Acidimicrobiia bacterium]|nr:hypothetical protein [Acidimicrobiia bacterium]
MGFDVDQFVQDCREALSEATPQLAVRDVVERAVRQPNEIEDALGVADGWRATTLHNDADLTILHFIWPPTADLFPHEHKMWSTVGIYGGIEDNTLYRKAGQALEVVGHKRGEVGDVVLMGAEAIHSVTNGSRQWTAALHVYGGDFFANPRLQWDKTTFQSKPYELANGRAELMAAEERARDQGIIT